MAHSQRAFDPLVDQQPARYVVGIDLGTTNSAVSYVDTHATPWRVESFLLPQVVAPGQVAAHETLPSFHYEALTAEAAGGALRLPWSTRDERAVVGMWARDEGARTAGRLVSSAKSWLCHSGIDRTASVLPWHAAADVERLSPVEASARCLRHMHDAWNQAFPDAPLAEQDIVLTLPASFDEVARELTVEAAAVAGLPRVVLIEEPQAAFYAWVYKHRADWQSLVAPGQKILICDIGGGTTDFTLLHVRAATEAGQDLVQFHRVAVGEHLILGGDNLDLALARHVEQRLAGTAKLESRQWDVLVRNCRRAKEALLTDPAPDTWTIHVPAPGSRLLAGSVQVQLTRAEVEALLVDGFLPSTDFEELPRGRQSGFQEFGLPYATDAAITRYLAAFLRAHATAAEEETTPDDRRRAARPDLVLFNGGFFASALLRRRLLEVLSGWFAASDTSWSPVVLDNDKLNLAVANGAAYYGMVRRGEGVRITANLARSYYVGVESDPPAAVCLLPGSTQPGQQITLSEPAFTLTISEPVEFPLYVSSTRLTDRPGDLVTVNPEQMRALPPIRTVLRAQRRRETGTVPVELHALLSEIGTIELWCAEPGSERSWRLQFDVRAATQTDIVARQSAGEAAGTLDETTWRTCAQILESVFGPAGTASPEGLMKQLSECLESSRDDWPPTLLRRMWEVLLELEAGRRKSPAHEARWLNLTGFALRPGYGLAVDDWRVSETWRTVRGQLAFGTPASRNESFILWRRIAGGLSAGQQQALAEPLLPSLREVYRRGRKARPGDRRRSSAEAANDAIQIWCLAGALELLPIAIKLELGQMLAELLKHGKLPNAQTAMVWALGRIAQRVPTYGPLNTVVDSNTAAEWLSVLMGLPADGGTHAAVMQIARRTDDRYRDVDEACRRQVLNWLSQQAAQPHLLTLVREAGELDADEQARVFGESLPKGLKIVRPVGV